MVADMGGLLTCNRKPDGFLYETMETAMQSSARRKRALSDDRLDSILRALSDRTRRQLLVRLASGPAMVSELAEPFAMSRVAISKHLRVLEQARLVARTIDGRVHEC